MVMFTVVAGMGKSDWSGKLGCLMTNQKPERRDSSARMNEKSRWGRGGVVAGRDRRRIHDTYTQQRRKRRRTKNI